MQKSLKIEQSISSTSTFPTIAPRCLVANLRSSAAISMSLFRFFLRKFSISFKHSFNLTLCLSLVIKTLLDVVNFLLNFSFIKVVNSIIFLLFFTDINTTSTLLKL